MFRSSYSLRLVVLCVFVALAQEVLKIKKLFFAAPSLPSYRSSSSPSAQSRGAVPPTSSSASYYYCDVH